jgi:GT2 family glycosyltransferase
MDDDVTVEPTWLENLTRVLRDGGYGGAGGRILPERPFLAPRWLSVGDRYVLGPLTLFDLGPEAGPTSEPPFGANMAFRKDRFEKYGNFRTDLDRCGEGMLSNGDTEFGHRLLDAGERLYYEPSAVVYHPVPESRLQTTYFLAWWFGKGRSDIRQFGTRPNTKYSCWGVPLYLFRNLAVWTLRWVLTIEPRLRFSCKLKVWAKLGAIAECYHQSLAAKRRHNAEALRASA